MSNSWAISKINVGTVLGYKLHEKPSNFLGSVEDANKYNVAFRDALDSLNIQCSTEAHIEDIVIKIKTIYFDGLSKHVLFETKGDVLAACRVLDAVHKRLSK